MRKMSLIAAISTFGLIAFAGESIELKFSGKRIDSYIKQKRCTVKDGVLSMSGDTASKDNKWRMVVLPLSFKAPAGRKFTFKGEIKGEKIKGRFEVAIRLIKADGKSLKYETYTITKDQDWKKFSKTFTAPEKTAKMQFYILARGMGDESIGSVKNLSIEQL